MPRAKKVVEPMPDPKPKYTEEELKEIEKKILSEKEVTQEDKNKSFLMSKEADEKKMEEIRMAQDPKGKFILVDLGGGAYRVMNKRKQWVSPVCTLNIGAQLTSKFNVKDPEQRAINVSANRKEGIWTDNEKV